MTALGNFLALSNLHVSDEDTLELERLTALGEVLLGIADVHLEIITGIDKPEGPAAVVADNTRAFNAWITMTGQMAAELYAKSGMLGVERIGETDNRETFTLHYSDMLLKLIQSKNFQKSIQEG